MTEASRRQGLPARATSWSVSIATRPCISRFADRIFSPVEREKQSQSSILEDFKGRSVEGDRWVRSASFVTLLHDTAKNGPIYCSASLWIQDVCQALSNKSDQHGDYSCAHSPCSAVQPPAQLVSSSPTLRVHSSTRLWRSSSGHGSQPEVGHIHTLASVNLRGQLPESSRK
eukprot:7730492-Pyramimonas_sp.AAC.1